MAYPEEGLRVTRVRQDILRTVNELDESLMYLEDLLSTLRLDLVRLNIAHHESSTEA